MAIQTPNLGLPLETQGHVALQITVEEGFKKIDAAVGAAAALATGTDVAPRMWSAKDIHDEIARQIAAP